MLFHTAVTACCWSTAFAGKAELQNSQESDQGLQRITLATQNVCPENILVAARKGRECQGLDYPTTA